MFDKTEALKEFDITEEVYDDLLLKFVLQARDNLVILESSCSAGNSRQAQSVIHALKGVAGNLRVTPAYSIAVTLEEAIRTSQEREINNYTLKLKAFINELFFELKK